MGAEFYAHFAIGAEPVASEELEEAPRRRRGGEEATDGGGIVAIARLSPQSRARSGEQAELWLDATRLHFFDAESGQALTHEP